MVDQATIHAAIPIPIEKIREICERYPIRELAIFGSALREDFGTKSDIDLLVQFEPNTRIGYMGISKIAQAFESVLNRDVDLVEKEALRWFVRDEILSTARVIYEAE